MSNEADLKAIDDLFRRTAPVTPEATQLRQSWMTWFPTLGWWAMNYDQATLDEAKTRRNKFNLANATTQAQKDRIVEVFTKSFDVKGPVAPTGEVGTQIKKPTPTNVLQGSHPVIKQGSKGPAVIEWQNIIGVKADGNFGPGTHSATVGWQKVHKDADGKPLTADGIVGQKTWQAALGGKAADAPPVKADEPSFLSALNPFSSTPAPAAPTVVATAAKPKPAAKPPATSTASPAPKPATATPAATSTPSAVASSGGKVASTNPIQVAQAGMFGALEKLPLWAKVAAFIGAAGVVIFGRNAKMVTYNVRDSKRSRRRAA